MIHERAFIHEKAHTDDSVTIGSGCRVWQFASIVRGTVLGDECSVAPGAVLDGPVFGDRCVININVAMGPGFWIGNDCHIGPGVVLCNDAFPLAVKEGFKPELFDGSRWAVILEDGVSIGANAVILPGVRVGAGAMVAGGAVCCCDVPAGHLYVSKNDIRPLRVDLSRRMRFAS